MRKILYAIQQKAAESYLTSTLAANDIIPVGSAAYREAILPALRNNDADLLIYRESLKGSSDTFRLMLDIRREFPNVRIIFIANEQPATSDLLCGLVCLGIYDILNSNNPNLSDITDFILHPRDFSFADKYFQPNTLDELATKNPDLMIQHTAQIEEQKGRGNAFPFFQKRKSIQGQDSEGLSTPSAPNTPEVPKLNVNALRSAILADARRTAQAEASASVDTKVAAITADLKAELTQKDITIADLTQEVTSLKQQIADADTLRQSLECSIKNLNQSLASVEERYQTALHAARPPEWYREQALKWSVDRERFQQEIKDLSSEISTMRSLLESTQAENKTLSSALADKEQEITAIKLTMPCDLSTDTEFDPLLSADHTEPLSDIEIVPRGGSRLLTFIGVKHGVGNTTVALNTAMSLADCGYKTCYIEINRQFPVVNVRLGFSNIVRGLDGALSALQQNDIRSASLCIIKPHGIRTYNKDVQKMYQHLPGPFHVLLYSNAFLAKCKQQTVSSTFSAQDMSVLIRFLLIQERYSYVVLDLQPDDQETISALLRSNPRSLQLILTLTQDPHCVVTAQSMITRLARSGYTQLPSSAQFVVNQFSVGNKLTTQKICSQLHVHSAHISKITFDGPGYMDACCAMVPYVISKGKYSREYTELREVIA